MVVQPGGLFDGGCNTLDFCNAFCDRIQPGEPPLPFSGMVACNPCLNSRQHTHHLLATDLVVATRSVMWRTRLPCRHKYFFLPKDKACALWSADGFTSAIHHHGSSTLKLNVV